MGDRIKVKTYPGVYYRDSTTRRLNGQPDRCFEFTFTYPATQKTGRKKVGWRSEGYSAKIASEMRAEHIQRLRHGQTLAEGRKTEVTFAEAFDIYYTDHALTNKTSHRDDKSLYQTHLKHRFEHRLLSQVRPTDLERIKAELRWPTEDLDERETIKEEFTEQGKLIPWRSNGTINHILGCVSRIYNKMIQWPERSGYLGSNPSNSVKTLPKSRSRQRFLTKEEAHTLLKALKEKSTQVYALALLSLGTGMRRSELFRMRWVDVDLSNGVINLPNAKGGKDQKVHLPPQGIELLNEMQTEEAYDSVFTDDRGRRLTDISHTYDRTVSDLGLNKGVIDSADKVVWHTLRHTYASWLAQSGKVTLVQLREIMRHKDIKTTMRYVHLLPDADGKTAATIVSDFLHAKGKS